MGVSVHTEGMQRFSIIESPLYRFAATGNEWYNVIVANGAARNAPD